MRKFFSEHPPLHLLFPSHTRHFAEVKDAATPVIKTFWEILSIRIQVVAKGTGVDGTEGRWQCYVWELGKP
ncbi:MAG: hypothetical protein RID09_08115 [Coleofasciculus sp. G1-WW12-02]|uniref:hypothetical protein n=1 Tax=unclassified Coleofasciculus TaxID=2692782 RepID=UPI0033012BF9